ncbi:unnamed protein product [Rotaria socialis]|uniref:Protein max n=4 Tax=Rotaria TaxID=231623 RepID=A0A818S0Z2_9BILA|nr:unnamed protein product [Rotaria socialis]CAF3455279.1 unnamed protein product [Rotaria socialis]CAF3665195.1 unnamed protein product [Rotaria socialis]CAF3774883.1 unnamed protein product [Rotaria socialis]
MRLGAFLIIFRHTEPLKKITKYRAKSHCFFGDDFPIDDKIKMSSDLDQYNDNHMESDDMDMPSNMQNNSHNQAEKRAHHNALERKRRDHIKGSFNDLRDVIPVLKGEKASRAHILKSATDYIQSLKSKTQQHQKLIDDLKRQNAILELQTRLLDRVKETSLYAQSHEKKTVKNEPEIQTTRNLLN